MKNVILIFLFPFLSFAQQEHNIWYFGNNAGLDFSTGSPTVLMDGSLATWEGCASVCSGTGELLFYTDGMSVWNKNHVQMPNGTGLGGNISTTQTISIPLPNSTDKYYIISLEEAASYNTGVATYSEVDMSLDGGLGDVTLIKGLPFENSSTEKITAVKHANGVDYWLLLHKRNSGIYLSYLLTASGISSVSIESNVGVLLADGDMGAYTGYLKASLDGSMVAAAHGDNGTEVLQFDNSTGFFELLVHIQERHYGVEFSPSGRFLYASKALSHHIHQYDLESGSTVGIQNSVIELGDNSNWLGYSVSALQTGPDGKIYVAKQGEDILNVIHNPNELGLACIYEVGAIDLQGNISKLGLPPAIPVNAPSEEVDYELVTEPIAEPDIVVNTDDPFLIMPNVITPNGDLINDVFISVKSVGLTSSEGVVLNRWGKIMYQGNLLSEGWKGTNRKGKPCVDGVYFWTIRCYDMEGLKHEYHGDVTVIR